jgi:hypothetical protein
MDHNLTLTVSVQHPIQIPLVHRQAATPTIHHRTTLHQVEEVAAVMLVGEATATTTIMVVGLVAPARRHHQSSRGSIKVGPISVTQTATGANGESISKSVSK